MTGAEIAHRRPRRAVSPQCMAAVSAMLLACPVMGQSVVYVNAAAPPGGDGSSWLSAFNDLHDGLAAGADQVWLAAGVYHPAPPSGSREASFILTDGVAVYGGFAGGEGSIDQRDPAANPTILSGDLNDDDGDQALGPWANMSDNSYHVVRAIGITSRARLDGVTVARGWSWQSSGTNSNGAGLYIDAAAIDVANCRFEGNLAHNGAGLVALRSDLRVSGCRFVGNYVPGGRGGGMYVEGDWQSPGTLYPFSVTDCEFTNNIAEVNGSGVGDAGALWVGFDAPITMRRCMFDNNQARWRFTSGSAAANGGALVVFGAGSTIDRCTFRRNRAHVAGAIWIGGDVTIANTIFAANEAFRQSSGFYDYGGYAGAVFAAGGAALVDNCTFHANTARSVGGLMQGIVGSVTIANSILWSNTSTEEEATVLDMQLGGTVTLRYSCVRGLFEQVFGEDPPNPADFPGCIDTDPLVTDPAGPDGIPGTLDDDLRLAGGSPCIDAGDNAMLPPWAALDAEGLERRADDPSTSDTGAGFAPIIDIGAYEFGADGPVPGDITEPFGVVDVFDLLLLLQNWNTNGAGASIAPPFSVVDVFDLLVLLENWES